MTLLALFATDSVATGWTFENWMAFAALILSNVGIILKQILDARASRQRGEASVKAVETVNQKVDEVKVATDGLTTKLVESEKKVERSAGRDEEREKNAAIQAGVAIGVAAVVGSEMGKAGGASSMAANDGKPPLEPGNVVKADLTGSLKVK